jgi:hypothetical protein
MKKIIHEQFKIKAQEMFDGQFPNDITMYVPRDNFMSVYKKQIRGELKEWINVTIDKYKELVETIKEYEYTNIEKEN